MESKRSLLVKSGTEEPRQSSVLQTDIGVNAKVNAGGRRISTGRLVGRWCRIKAEESAAFKRGAPSVRCAYWPTAATTKVDNYLDNLKPSTVRLGADGHD